LAGIPFGIQKEIGAGMGIRQRQGAALHTRFQWAGFTLIEVMTVVAIAAVLATLAFPSYQHAIRKAKRAEARAALLQLMQQQERYYMLNTRYIPFGADLSGAEASKFKWFSGESPTVSAYEIRGSACAGESLQDCIILTATAGSAKVDRRYRDPNCSVMTLSNTGVKLPTDRDCW
jgi:type IV pilus assembly protein PilE